MPEPTIGAQQVRPNIRMLMVDVDGTLVTPDKALTECAKQAVFQLRNSGLKFTLISSRPSFGMKTLANELRVDQPMVAFNGGLLFGSDGKSILEHLLPANLISSILDCLQQYGLSPRVYTWDHWLIESAQQPHLQEEICTLEAQPILVDSFVNYFEGIFKITGVSDNIKAMAQCQSTMQALLLGQASVLCSQNYYLDITHHLANKGAAVASMAELLNIPQSEIAVIGDMPSDVPMFKVAGLSIAMGNASDEVKRQADYVTDTNAAEGFAKAMEQYILGQTSTLISQ